MCVCVCVLCSFTRSSFLVGGERAPVIINFVDTQFSSPFNLLYTLPLLKGQYHYKLYIYSSVVLFDIPVFTSER